MRWTPFPDRADILSTGRRAQEGQAVPDARQHVVPVLGGHQVPLVQGHDGRAPRDADALGQPLVLVGRPDGGVDDQDGHIGALQRPQRAHGRVLLGAAVGLGRPAEPGRVDEAHRPVGRLDHRVDGVAGGARHVVDDGALLAQEAVEERRLPDVRPADDGDARRARVTVTSGAVLPAGSRSASSSSSGSGTGSSPTTSSSRSPVPRPCSELTGKGSPNPRATNSQAAVSRLAPSTLLTTSRTGGPARRITLAAARSSSVTPVVTSTTMRITSASARARSACSLTLASSASPAASQPPVSMMENGTPDHSGRELLPVAGHPLLLLDDRGPASPTIRFTREDLPTLGRPATTTIGLMIHTPVGRTCRRVPGAARSPRWARPRPTWAGPPASARRGSGPRSGTHRAAGSANRRARPWSARATSSPVSRPATPILPPKKSFGDGAQLHVMAWVRCNERPQDAGPVGAGEDRDRDGHRRRPAPLGAAAAR